LAEGFLRTLILGFGDGTASEPHVGLEVARRLHDLLKNPDVDIIETPAAGTDLFELAAGYGKVVVVDCVESGQGDVGELRRLGLDDLELVPREGAGHEHEYRAVVEFQGAAGSSAPLEISIYAIEMGSAVRRRPGAGDMLRDAVPRLVEQIAREEFGAGTPGGWI
jgi:hydrogenase maturation protease